MMEHWLLLVLVMQPAGTGGRETSGGNKYLQVTLTLIWMEETGIRNHDKTDNWIESHIATWWTCYKDGIQVLPNTFLLEM